MEVDNASFYPKLLSILDGISNASFVSFDLEMSGISIRQHGGVSDRSRDSGKITMQQQYEETKEAAERYQILQMGITCVFEDHELGTYVARPYNFNVSPLFIDDDRLGINRDFTFSSSAIHFLVKNSFNIGTVFDSGVPYLSREEDATARRIYADKIDRSSSIGDIVLDPSDEDAMAFYLKARETMVSWTRSKKRELEFVNISHYPALNAFQRRLVYQLVRNEFPGYRAFARDGGNFMQVEKEDPVREAKIAAAKVKGFELGLAKQTGLTYIIEALAGGYNLEEIEPTWFCKTETGDTQFIDVNAIRKEINKIQNVLRTKQIVVVGHNLFTDLIFLYRTFITELPDTVEEFQEEIHALFPYIIDTKYLATHGGGSMTANLRLKDLFNELNDNLYPMAILDVKHSAYSGKTTKEHEAGYDSWMTAQVLIKLSAKLAEQQKHASAGEFADENEDDVYATFDKALIDHVDEAARSGSFYNSLDPHSPRKAPRPIRNGQKFSTKNTPIPIQSRFSSENSFNQLQVEDSDPSSESDGGVPISPPRSTSTYHKRESSLMDTDFDDHFRVSSHNSVTLQPGVRDTNGLSDHQMRAGPEYHAMMMNSGPKLLGEEKVKKWIPKFNTPFWGIYANKLRVNGTDSGICQLGD